VRYRWIFPLLSFAMVPALVLTAFYPKATLAVLAVAFVNFIVTLVFKPTIQVMLPALRALPGLVDAAARLRYLDRDCPALSAEATVLRDNLPELQLLRRSARWLLFEPGEAGELVAALHEYVNMFFLVSVNALVFGLEEARGRRATLRATWDAVGALDVAQSVATLRDEWTTWCKPDSAPAKTMDIERIWHPLLETPVANSIALDGVSLIVTGSNMSGKTTFIRTLGVAAILARAIDTVPAAHWRAPPLTVLASIARSDSIIDGKSYYLAEVERVRDLIESKREGSAHLFLLDEIFRGTNTTERIAAGKAVLAELDRGDDIVVVATHDLELLAMLSGRYVSYHFREEIDGESLRFDYTIKSGASSTRNAIALLRLMHFPDRVVDDALASAAAIEEAVDARREHSNG
jgi:DNA mismatch repair ATPase MutS